MSGLLDVGFDTFQRSFLSLEALWTCLASLSVNAMLCLNPNGLVQNTWMRSCMGAESEHCAVACMGQCRSEVMQEQELHESNPCQSKEALIRLVR